MVLYDITDVFIVAIKEAVKAKGLPISSYARIPGTPITSVESERIRSILKQFNII